MKKKPYKIRLTGLLLLILAALSFSCQSKRAVTVKELEDHIRYLSSDSLKGRLTGSAGDSLAAEYIRHALLSYGFKPLILDGFQHYKVISKLVAGKNNFMETGGKSLIAEQDFMPMPFSSDSVLDTGVIFAGYGFDIKSDTLTWNDYAGIDVRGKWVLILRADPEADKSISNFIPFSGDRDKALMAKDMGAAGVLLVSGQLSNPEDKFEPLNSNDFSVGIPVIRIKREIADLILSKAGRNINQLEQRLNARRSPFSFATGMTVSAGTEVKREMKTTRNVVMILPGEDSTLKKQYIIMGAHFDHLGMGGPGSGSRVPDTVGIHHGADDNASGVSMMLALAQEFAYTPGSHKRSIICIAFSGEEEGLLGSKHYVEDPGIDLSKVNAMINLDMVGRLKETNVLDVSGVGTADSLRNIVLANSDTSVIKLALSDEGYGPSDHSSFYGKNIPVLFYTTGAHLDYHTPSDTYDKINYEGMVREASLIFSVEEKLADSPSRLKFREAGPVAGQTRDYRYRGITLGIMPDFAGNVKNGLRADFVSPGRPAALGGMKKGDIITAINGKTVNNIQDYMYRMNQLKRGQTITVEIRRDDKKVVLLIQL